MKRLTFEDGMDEIYAAFGKKSPEPRVLDAAFRRVENLPDEFMAFCVKRLPDEEKLPQNLGRFMLRELWPEFLDRRPELRSQVMEHAPCQRCNMSDMPGYIRVWHTERREARVFRCTCNNAASGLEQPSDAWLMENGYVWEAPAVPENHWLRSLLGRQFRPRPEHEEYLESMEI